MSAAGADLVATAAGAAGQKLLNLDQVSIALSSGARQHTLIDRLSLTVAKGETVALVGESGSGKSLTARAIVGLLPARVRVVSGSIRMDGEDLASLPPHAMNAIRGRRIGMIFQQPQQMLDPTCRVGPQVVEALRKHRGLPAAAAHTRMIQLLREVGIADPEQRARAYAFELSGGLAQRVMIAAALSADPDLLIADEPTTALDVTVQAQILRLLDEQRRKRHMAILFISHDLSIVSAVASRVVVMYAGRVVEEGPTARILGAPRHPYTKALVDSSLLQPNASGLLASIRGSLTAESRTGRGCRFHPRCDVAQTLGQPCQCSHVEPELRPSADGARCRCWAVELADKT